MQLYSLSKKLSHRYDCSWVSFNKSDAQSLLSEETVYWGALLGCLEMIASGTTTFSDGYFLQDHAIGAVQESGLRAIVAQGIIDFPALLEQAATRDIALSLFSEQDLTSRCNVLLSLPRHPLPGPFSALNDDRFGGFPGDHQPGGGPRIRPINPHLHGVVTLAIDMRSESFSIHAPRV